MRFAKKIGVSVVRAHRVVIGAGQRTLALLLGAIEIGFDHAGAIHRHATARHLLAHGRSCGRTDEEVLQITQKKMPGMAILLRGLFLEEQLLSLAVGLGCAVNDNMSDERDSGRETSHPR
jgi:hypothetical protein